MRASLPTVASAETTRQVNTRPASDAVAAPVSPLASPKLARGTIHAANAPPKVGGNLMPTHNYASGMQGVHVTHEQ